MDSEQRALLNAILVDPEDDAPRGIYADWLDDHEVSEQCPTCKGEPKKMFHGTVGGQGLEYLDGHCFRCNDVGSISNGFSERAEFIRVQLALAKLGPKRVVLVTKHKNIWGRKGKYEANILFPKTETPPEVGSLVDVEVRDAPKEMRQKYHGLLLKSLSGRMSHSSTLWDYAATLEMGEWSIPWNGDKLSQREGELIRLGRDWFKVEGLATRTERFGGSIHGWLSKVKGANAVDIPFEVSRGFVNRMRLPVPHLLEYGAAIFSTQPIQRVELSDTAAPTHTDDNKWTVWSGDSSANAHHIPRVIYDKLRVEEITVLPRGEGGIAYRSKRWGSREEAEEALSKACVEYGRELAGLPSTKIN